jgi:predicted N-formylglutamate amidohydrolase
VTFRSARDFVIVTCEHGGNRIPAEYQHLFRGWHRILRTHRGFDAGALVMARDLAKARRAPLVYSTVSRLVIDLNRSLGHPNVWSDATRGLPAEEKARIVRRYYAPYRHKVMTLVADAVRSGKRVVHLSSHSFTPVLDGVRRNADLGFLYDPARPGEARLAASWKAALGASVPDLRVRRNYPYNGKADGLTTSLRKAFSAGAYVGIEIEINHDIAARDPAAWRWVRQALIAGCPTWETSGGR